ncbi:GNAT family N-acetyltransferase [Falcatimonas sp. MSJ-15]|uniref:GNAT family N-acetyltransferase n=1 Tax=Falcatimonas sp. MSJ-15 TaxID=2841515 RepID=UPI001C0F467C|nr:GNAT family N-acetyltransferase [Falcatimonas sp. MSJ-15]MBU5471535.1 GNAT family N-acetyltransferase [Falcatimonas sp. MSJ-15]
MIIRKAIVDDIFDVAAVERECFPQAEAATQEEFRDRIEHYGNHFLLMYDEDRLVAFIDGMVTDEKDLTDEMYADASMHNEGGRWQMIFGVNTLPDYRRRGFAGELIKAFIDEARSQGRLGLVLTCKDELIHYYAKFGFVNEGVSGSEHGGVKWNQMRIRF